MNSGSLTTRYLRCLLLVGRCGWEFWFCYHRLKIFLTLSIKLRLTLIFFSYLKGTCNSNHLFLASQDHELRAELRKIPGINSCFDNCLFEFVVNEAKGQISKRSYMKIKYVKFSEKRTFTPWYAHVRVRIRG